MLWFNRNKHQQGMIMYKPGETLREALKRIERNDYVLPAIQREFVWHPEQISKLFDSLRQGYPRSAFGRR